MKFNVEHEDAIVLFWEKTRDYLVPVHDGGGSGILMRFCPWCGADVAGDEALSVYRAKRGAKNARRR